MKDILGQDIVAGSLIVYARVSGSSADMKIAKVLAVKEIIIPDYYAQGNNNGGSRDKIDYRITCVVKGHYYNTLTGKREDSISKKFTLYSPTNCVVINPNLVPAEYADIFAKVKI
jgi:hypothetical protein